MKEVKCSICGSQFNNSAFAIRYPNLVCRKCDKRAVNEEGVVPRHNNMTDDGDNPVFIDGIKCWRRYRFGGFITMRDDYDCKTFREFHERHIKQR